jgi:3' terminal RNA ribose 2'-O-methyltransferase Hen1
MLLTISTTYSPATSLGYLLHKSPYRPQSFDLSFGKAHVFYPEVQENRCTAALLLDIDPVGLVRGRGGPRGDNRTLDQYVNDRPYVASSFLSVAIARVFGSALSGKAGAHEELARSELPLAAKISVVPCRGGEEFLRRLFEPLGYEVKAEPHLLDEQFPEWGPSSYFTVELTAQTRLQELLTHLYVLLPVLDNEKHYFVGDAEVDKLLRRGEGWLAEHPERETIARRYLKHRRSLADEVLARLIADEQPNLDVTEETRDNEELAIERPLSLNEQRYSAVIAAVKGAGTKRVIDLGCGEGRLLRKLLEERSFEEIVGMDVSHRSLEIAAERLRLDRMPPKQRERIHLLQGSLTYRDQRIAGFDAATVVEVIEHLDANRLSSFARALFEFARPKTVVVTTPNAEYNVKFEGLPAGKFRHRDHRFEWSRAEFRAWAEDGASRYGYSVRFLPIGDDDPVVGPPTQMGVFTTADATPSITK